MAKTASQKNNQMKNQSNTKIERGPHPINIGGEQFFLQFDAPDVVAIESLLGIGISRLFRPETRGVRIACAFMWGGLKRKLPDGRLVNVFRDNTFDSFGYSATPFAFIDVKKTSDMILKYLQDPNSNGMYGLFEEFAKAFITSGWARVDDVPTSATASVQ
ncbi:MAG TPA: hypothetical protein PKM50_08085 [Methanoregula sp.]|nr:hypothetical protein [Methanoregula sp.]